MHRVPTVLDLGATTLNGAPASQELSRQPRRYAHSMLPAAAGYAIAHYFSPPPPCWSWSWSCSASGVARPWASVMNPVAPAPRAQIDLQSASTREPTLQAPDPQPGRRGAKKPA